MSPRSFVLPKFRRIFFQRLPRSATVNSPRRLSLYDKTVRLSLTDVNEDNWKLIFYSNRKSHVLHRNEYETLIGPAAALSVQSNGRPCVQFRLNEYICTNDMHLIRLIKYQLSHQPSPCQRNLLANKQCMAAAYLKTFAEPIKWYTQRTSLSNVQQAFI